VESSVKERKSLFYINYGYKKIEIGVKMLLLMRGARIKGLFTLKLPRKLDIILVRILVSRVDFKF
jgi:hypothetical protein